MTVSVVPAPMAWVGCLSCYNGGRLTGDWLDADGLEDEDTLAGVCSRPGHEELWVMDTDGLPGVGECSPDEAARVARAVERVYADAADHGVPVPVVVEWVEDSNVSDPDCWPRLDDALILSGDSRSDIAYGWVEDNGTVIPNGVVVDWSATFDELFPGAGVYVHEGVMWVIAS